MSAAVFGDVTSANIVGYAGSALNGGMKNALISPMFSGVGKSAKEIRLGDIKPTRSGGTVGNAMVVIYTLTSGGKSDQAYQWTGSYWKHNNIDASEETFPEGKGLWVRCNLAAANSPMLQSAGEVNTTEDQVVLLNGGMKNTATGNGFPVAVKFGDIVPEAVTEGKTVGNAMVVIYTLTSGGKSDQAYQWTGSYWKHNNVDASEETLPAGNGIWVRCNIAEATTRVNLRIKNPLVK